MTVNLARENGGTIQITSDLSKKFDNEGNVRCPNKIYANFNFFVRNQYSGHRLFALLMNAHFAMMEENPNVVMITEDSGNSAIPVESEGAR